MLLTQACNDLVDPVLDQQAGEAMLANTSLSGHIPVASVWDWNSISGKCT
jgi:hypothetical protein